MYSDTHSSRIGAGLGVLLLSLSLGPGLVPGAAAAQTGPAAPEQEAPIPFPYGGSATPEQVAAAATALLPAVESASGASSAHVACYLKKLQRRADDHFVEWSSVCPGLSDGRTSELCAGAALGEGVIAGELVTADDVEPANARLHFLSRLGEYAVALQAGRSGGADAAGELDRIAREMSVARRRIRELGQEGGNTLAHYRALSEWIEDRAVDPQSIYSCGTVETGIATRSGEPAPTPDVVFGASAVRSRLQGSRTGKISVIARVAPQVTSRSGEVTQRDVETAQESLVVTMRDAGVPEGRPLEDTDLVVMEVDAAQLQQLIDSGRVDAVTENRRHRPVLAQSVPLIKAPEAWAVGARGRDQVVAVIDTGVDRTHPFLEGKVVAEACFSTHDPPVVTSACPGNATVARGEGSGMPCAAAGCNHGTHVAGIVAGENSTQSGVAPLAKLIAIQVFSLFNDQPGPGGATPCADDGVPSPCESAFTADIILALKEVQRLARTHPIVAVNMSIGDGSRRFPGACNGEPEKREIDRLLRAGITSVIASGNDDWTDAAESPGCITTAVTVGATQKDDVISTFSNSSPVVDLLAPGTSINSSVLSPAFADFDGTSMATPHVAGAFAVLRSHKPQAGPASILNALRLTGKAITDGRGACAAAGAFPACATSGLVKPRIVLKDALDVLALTQGRNEAGDAFGHAVASGDFDGDGRADLAIGTPGENVGDRGVDSGFVFMFQGADNGLRPWAGVDQQGLDQNEAQDRFGQALVVADFDRDGKDDLAVGAPGETVSGPRSGAVYVFRGTADGLRGWTKLDQTGLGRNEAADRFGAALAAGDLDGDGTPDLAVGAPGEAIGTGRRSGFVFLFKGGASLTAWKPRDAAGTEQVGLDQTGLDADGNEFGDEFGASLAVGDFDHDARLDLAVGAPGDTTGGKVFVFRGTPTGPVAWADAEELGVQIAGGTLSMTGDAANPSNGDRYGESLAAGDFDADGDTDLAIGAPGDVRGSAGRSGSVYLLLAGNSELTPGPILGQAPLDTDERGDRFGAGLTAGDFDGDGKRDLAVGAPGERPTGGPQSGIVYLFRGGGGGPTPRQALDQGQMGTNEAGDLFGHALANGDFDRDGKADLAIGAPGEAPGPDPRSGYVFLYNGDSGNMIAREGLGQGN